MNRVLVMSAVLMWGCGAFVSEVAARGGGQAGAALSQIVAKFDALDAASVDVEKWKAYTNEDGSLAWGTSYLLEAYLDMYEATRNRGYLDKFMILADALTKRTDIQRDLADYKGRKRVGWGAVKYSKAGERVVWLAHSGMITYPLARFVMIANRSPALSGLADMTRRLRDLTEAALHEFDRQWRYDSSSGSGYYVFEDSDPIKVSAGPETPVPFNQQLAAGGAFIVLWKLTGNSGYQQKAEGLARHFKGHLRMDSTGGYEWDYWYGKGLARYRSLEDISHGAIDVDFAVRAAQESLVLSRDDIVRFVLAFFRYTNSSEGNVEQARDAAGRWLELAGLDCRVYHRVFPHLMAKDGSQHSQVLLGVAKLAKYVRSCAEKKQ
jgi:hypothetical protein